MEVLRLSNATDAAEFWSERTKQASELAKIGRASDDALATNIDRVADQMKGVGATNRAQRKLTLDQVYDFSFVKKAYEELRTAKWDPNRYGYVKR
jgi:hypothetical protein